MSEIKESIDRAHQEITLLIRNPDEGSLNGTLMAIIDTLVEIAAVLPAPHTVPKE